MVEKKMRAAVLTDFGRSLELTELPKPAVGPGQVLVRVVASGVNPLDTKIQTGQAAHARSRLPAVLGLDLAGVVEAVGQGVRDVEPGAEVFGLTGGVGDLQGSLAQYAAVDARLIAPKPRSVDMRQAAALPLVAITAWEGLVDRAGVRAGQSVLVHGGAGGVGHIAIQIARARGANVYATGSPARLATIAELGAIPIDRTRSNVDQYVAEHTGGEGFDIVYDAVGALDDAFRAVRVHTGHVVSTLGWGTHSIAPLSFRGATYSGVFALLPMLTGQGREHHGEILRAVAELVDAEDLRPLVDPRRFTLDTIAEAHAVARNGAGAGKLVVDIP